MVVLLTAKLPSILERVGEANLKTAKKKTKESISHRAQSKKTQTAEKDETDQETNQDDVILDRERNHDGKSKDINQE